MATQKEIDNCCAAVRRMLASHSISPDMKTAELTIAGLFLLESFLVDVKRIADALSDAADDRDGMGNK